MHCSPGRLNACKENFSSKSGQKPAKWDAGGLLSTGSCCWSWHPVLMAAGPWGCCCGPVLPRPSRLVVI